MLMLPPVGNARNLFGRVRNCCGERIGGKMCCSSVLSLGVSGGSSVRYRSKWTL